MLFSRLNACAACPILDDCFSIYVATTVSAEMKLPNYLKFWSRFKECSYKLSQWKALQSTAQLQLCARFQVTPALPVHSHDAHNTVGYNCYMSYGHLYLTVTGKPSGFPLTSSVNIWFFLQSSCDGGDCAIIKKTLRSNFTRMQLCTLVSQLVSTQITRPCFSQNTQVL